MTPAAPPGHTASDPDEQAPGDAGGVPQTGDIVVDSALSELAGTDTEDLDGQLAAGESLQRTLQARLADLGG